MSKIEYLKPAPLHEITVNIPQVTQMKEVAVPPSPIIANPPHPPHGLTLFESNSAKINKKDKVVTQFLKNVGDYLNNNPNAILELTSNSNYNGTSANGYMKPNPTIDDVNDYNDENGHSVHGTIHTLMLARVNSILHYLINNFRVRKSQILIKTGRIKYKTITDFDWK